jgi:hypothetical protein
LIKTLKRVGIEGKYINIIKTIYDKPITNIVLNGEKTETIYSKNKKKRDSSSSVSSSNKMR